jgi:AcrR family transcriptional regulator
MADLEPVAHENDENGPAWRQRAVSRSLNAARSRAEKRAQRFLDAAFELMDEKGTTDFTIQEVIDRSNQSLRGFYQYFTSKDELLLALFEETVRESVEDQRTVIASESDPLVRLRAFVIRLHEWCDPTDAPRKRGRHNRRPISEFMVQLVGSHPERVRAAIAPTAELLAELLDAAHEAGAIEITDTRHTTALVMRTVMYSWFGNRLATSTHQRISAEETWQFCLNGLRAPG